MSSQSPYRAPESPQEQNQLQADISPGSEQSPPSQPSTAFSQQPGYVVPQPYPQQPGYVVPQPYPQQPGYVVPQPYLPMQSQPGSYQPVPQYASYPGTAAVRQPKSGLAIASLVFGIIGVFTSWILVGIPFSIVGLVLAAVGIRRVEGKSVAISGLVLSILGIVVGIGVIVAIIVSPSSGPSSVPQASGPSSAPQASGPSSAPQVTPTLSAEDNYKVAAKTMTITAIVQSGDSRTNTIVHFQGIVVRTVTTADGTPVAIIADSSDSTKYAIVGFTKGTDLNKIADGDTIEIWGQDLGMIHSGTSSTPGIIARYFTDHTSGYGQ